MLKVECIFFQLIDDISAKNVRQCRNVNHELFIDNKHFMPILIEVIKLIRSKSMEKPKSIDERLAKTYNYLQWKLSENDLQEYWSTFIKCISNTVSSWNMFHQTMKRYTGVLLSKCIHFNT